MNKSVIVITLLGVLAGCATVPDGPSVAVMPAPGKSLDQFGQDNVVCKQFAERSVGTSASEAGLSSELKSIAVGTAIGVAAGALNGGHQGAGSGAAIGMLGGATLGAGAAQVSEMSTQRRYDIAYEQCMYAKGNQVPGMRQPDTSYRPPVPPEHLPAQDPSFYPPSPPAK